MQLDHHAVFEAITSGDVPRLQAVLALNPALAAARNERGLSAVLLARYHHRPQMVELLLAAGPELDIFEAAAVGRADRTDDLLDDDPSLMDAYSIDGFTPLQLAAYFGSVETVRLLLARGAEVRAVSRNALEVEALHSAVAGGGLEVVAALIAAGADANAPQGGGWTPLHAAVRNTDVPMVRLLLRHGADALRQAEDGASPLDLAEEVGSVELVELLRKKTP